MCVIVDEASMIDLALMAKLVAAVPPDARLILLGDRDQLASVEAGSVLADICAAAESATPNEPLYGAVVELKRNYRFAATGGIYRVSTAVNAGDADAAIAALGQEAGREMLWQPLPAAAKLPAVLCASAWWPLSARASKPTNRSRHSRNCNGSEFSARCATARSAWRI